MRTRAFGPTIVALFLLGVTTAAAADDPALERRVWIDVESEDLENVLGTLGSMIDLKRQVSPAITGHVTVRLENVTLRTALTAVCESAGCTWELVGDGPGRLRFAAAPAPPTPAPVDPGSTPVSLMFQDAQLADVVDALARMAGLTLVADPPLKADTLTLQLQEARLADVLDTLCRVQDLQWQVVGDELRITPAR